MEAIKDTVLEFGYRAWQLQPPATSMMIVVKATFDFQADQPCTLAPEQDPCGGDVHHDDDEELSLRSENDFAILKPRGECFVIGAAFAAGGRPATELQAGFRIGQVQKQFLVFGDRYWETGFRTRPSDPVPFTEMSLRRERAFGGPRHRSNPWGLGYKGHAPEPNRQLPNLERPEALISSPRSKPEPVITSATPMGDPNRLKLAGTYDAGYVRWRWPYFPDDFNWEFFMGAPEDQRITGYWRGDEQIELVNLHRERSIFGTQLPDIRPRVFLYRQPAATAEHFTEVQLALDTITVDTQREQVFCLWRGIGDVVSEDLEDIDALFLAHEQAGDTSSQRSLYERFLYVREHEDDEEEDEEDEFGGSLDLARTVIAPPIQAMQPAEDAPVAAAAEEAAPEPSPELQAVMAGVTPPPESEPPTPEKLKQRLAGSPYPPPPELLAMLDEAQEEEESEEEQEEPSEPDWTERERFFQVLQREEGMLGEVFENLDLSGYNLAGANLSGVSLIAASCVETDFRGADLTGAQLSGCELVRAKLQGARLDEADLSKSNLMFASLARANAQWLDASEAICRSCDLTGLRAASATFSRADLESAKVVGALLDEADLSGARAANADFTEASLQDADLEGIQLPGARFDRADLSRANASEGADFSGCSLFEVKAPGSSWEGANLKEADLSSSDLEGSFFSDALMLRTKLDGCQISQGTFARATMAHASCRATNLFEADLESADVSFVDFTAANLFGAEVWKANTNGACFTAARVTRTKIGAHRT